MTLANSQSKSSCLVQHRAESGRLATARNSLQESPFSNQQRQCIGTYASSVDADIPGFSARLGLRKFGGVGRPTANSSVILGAGFGTTATRSLFTFAAQLGLRAHHWQFGAEPAELWSELNDLVTSKHDDGFSGCVEALNAVNFSKALSAGYDVLLDTPLAEHFLDFYAVSPHSKVMLTTRNASDWVRSRLQFDPTLAAPLHSPCGVKLRELRFDAAVRLYQAHETLVRCMVPAENLMEINVFDKPVDVPSLLDFLGRPKPEYPPLYPRIGTEDSREDEDNFLICITGQITRLELKTKVERLFLPLTAAGFTVLVALVLDPRPESHYINRPAGTQYLNYTVTDGNFSTLEQAAGMLPKSIYFIGDPFIPRDYPVDGRYLHDLYETMPDKGWDHASRRAVSHMRQWETLERCGSLPWPEAKYMMRLRDDDALFETFQLPAEPEDGALYVPACNPCEGLNDKFALAVGQGAAQDYFRLPLQTVRWDFERLQQQLQRNPRRSPEQVLGVVMQIHAKTVKLLNNSELPVMPAKNMRDGHGTYLCFYAGSDNYRSCMPERVRNRLVAEGFQIHANPWTYPDFYCEKEPQHFIH